MITKIQKVSFSTMHVILIWLVAAVLSTPTATTADTTEWIYQMQAGDNLWNISREYLADVQNWRKLKKLNNIGNHRRLRPGTHIRIPIAWLKIRPLTVRVLSFTGDITATIDTSGHYKSLTKNTRLVAGDEIRSGVDGSALLEFADGSQVLLRRNSQLLLDMSNAYGAKKKVIDNRMRLNSGSTESKVSPNNDPSGHFEIRTPVATTGVRGTRYRMRMDKNQTVSHVEVIGGKVQVSAAGQTVTVTEKLGTVITRGQPPLSPMPLLTPPDLSTLPSRVEGLPYLLEWLPMTEARAYRVQIFPHSDPGALLIDEIHEDPRFWVSDIEDGTYALSIRAIDANALEGLNARHRLFLSKIPKPAVHSSALSKSRGESFEATLRPAQVPDRVAQKQRFLHLIPILVLLLLFIPTLLVLIV